MPEGLHIYMRKVCTIKCLGPHFTLLPFHWIVINYNKYYLNSNYDLCYLLLNIN
jgi:hypothetical protein